MEKRDAIAAWAGEMHRKLRTGLQNFGGGGLQPSGPRVRYQPSYSSRIIGGKTPPDLRQLHKYMLHIEKVTVISEEMRAGRNRMARAGPKKSQG
jgi:hypothetical protein